MRDAAIVGRLEHVGQDLGLDDEEFDARGLDGMGQLIRLIPGISARVDATGGYDAIDDDGVVDLGSICQVSSLLGLTPAPPTVSEVDARR